MLMIGDASIKKTIRQALRIDRALRLVFKSAPGWTMVNLALVVVQGLLPLGGLYAMKQMIDALTRGIASPDKAAAAGAMLFWVVLAGGIALMTALSRSISDLAGETQAQLLTDTVSDLLHAQSIKIDLEYYEDPGFQDNLHRAQEEAPYRPTRILMGLIQIGENGLTLLGVAALLFSINALLALLILAAALPTALVRLYYARRSYGLEQNLAEKERKAWYYHFLMTDPIQAKEVRLFDLGSLFRERYRDLRTVIREGRLTLKRKRAGLDFLSQALSTLAVFSALGFIALQTLRQTITLGSLVIYYQGFHLGLSSFQGVLRGLAGLYEDNLFLNNFYEFMDLQPKIQTPANPRPLPSSFGEIRFNDIGFRYPGKPDQVLTGIDLQLRQGEIIALVGENGSGKTTLIKLLSRLYDPSAGTIAINGSDLRELDPIQWRKKIAILLQDYARYYLSARENIEFGNPGHAPDPDAATRAARLSGADPVIQRLPLGYDTMLGTWFEGGRELSVGEWQKIALARALFREAELVILDEPTSSMDPRAEADFFQRFKEIIRGRTGILISHRFSTVQLADRIYVVHQGRIVEQGSHADLMAQDGRYAELYRAQAERYK
jgi:ATP-binding cassette, subfamily B, bacterial